MINIILYLACFGAIWIGAGLVIHSVEKFSRLLKLSTFSVSFLVLGFLTSLSELSVGVNSIIKDDPEIYVGNLIGASIVIFMLIVPLLAIVGRSLVIQPQFRGGALLFSLIVIALPVILSLDGKIDRIDSIGCMLSYFALVFVVEKKRNLAEQISAVRKKKPANILTEIIKIVAGIGLIFGASHYIVELTIYFSQQLHITPFLVSLILISIGTNLPELSLVVRSMFLTKKDVAFGDYVGSAACNTFLLGLLTIIYGKPAYLANSYAVSLLFLIAGLCLFYIFARTDNKLTRLEGFVLIALYVGFLSSEYILHF